MSTVDYPISLAAEDFVPVLLTGAGVAMLVPYLARRAPGSGPRAALGAALIFVGGASKATWKLVVALDGPDLRWLENALFPCLGVGFALLGHAALSVRTQRRPDTAQDAAGTPPLWAFLAVSAGACAAAAAIRATWPVLLLTIVMSTITAIRLILLARDSGDTPAAALMGTWLLGLFALGPLASRPDQSIALQWTEQTCNTAAQLAFVVACRRLSRVGKRDGRADPTHHPRSSTDRSGADT